MLLELLTSRYPGMRLWLTQRLTAVIMTAYIVLMVATLLIYRPSQFHTWHTLFSPWWMRLMTWLFFFCLVMHAWLGVRDGMRDYVFNLKLRQLLQLVVDALLVAYWIWLTVIMWEV